MINIDFLEYIVEFSKTQNLTRASETLHISQSALTRAMQKTEADVGVPLFKRTRNKIELNDTGREFVKRAQNVLKASEELISETVAFHNSMTGISIGLTAPGPIIKYWLALNDMLQGKTIAHKIDKPAELLNGLNKGLYDFVFINEEVQTEDIVSVFAFTEKLNVSVPKTHFIARMKDGLKFSEIDGQSFLIAKDIGLWDDIVMQKLPNSRFFTQDLENLEELINASVIPNFSTNVTIPIKTFEDRVDIPILDEEASVDFYLAYKKKNKPKISDLLHAMEINNRVSF